MFYFNALCIEMTTEKFVCGSSSGKHPSPSVCSPWKKTPWPLEVSHEPRTSPDLTGEQWEKWFQVMTHCKGAAAKGQFNRCVCVTQSVQGIKKIWGFIKFFFGPNFFYWQLCCNQEAHWRLGVSWPCVSPRSYSHIDSALQNYWGQAHSY